MYPKAWWVGRTAFPGYEAHAGRPGRRAHALTAPAQAETLCVEALTETAGATAFLRSALEPPGRRALSGSQCLGARTLCSGRLHREHADAIVILHGRPHTRQLLEGCWSAAALLVLDIFHGARRGAQLSQEPWLTDCLPKRRQK